MKSFNNIIAPGGREERRVSARLSVCEREWVKVEREREKGERERREREQEGAGGEGGLRGKIYSFSNGTHNGEPWQHSRYLLALTGGRSHELLARATTAVLLSPEPGPARPRRAVSDGFQHGFDFRGLGRGLPNRPFAVRSPAPGYQYV